MNSPFSEISPRDLSPLDPLTATSPESLSEIVANARRAQAAWGELPAYVRAERVARVKDRLLDRAASLAALVSLEVGKPEAEALLGEVLASADVFDFWCTSIEELCEPQEITLSRLTYPGKRGTIYREARGTIAVIMPWNFPIALPLRTLVPALLAGNAVVFKPSEISPRSGQALVELFAGLIPEGVLSIVQGGGEVGAALCGAAVDLVVFTGSVATGKKVASCCAERLIPCSLELGGKDAAIVMNDANIERTARGVAWAALTNAGQNCAAIERVYVERGISEPFIARLTEVVRGLEPGRDLGPLTTRAQRETVDRHVAAAREAGAEIVLGGTPTGDPYRYPATVVKVTTDDLELMREETFGPVIAVRVVEDVKEAIALANASKYGLTASIWTKRPSRALGLAHQLRAGVVTINNHAFTGALPAAPWSGHGQTGTGITNSHLALDAFTRPRFVLVDKGSSSRELWWYPYTPTLTKIGLAMAKLRSGSTGILKRVGAVLTLLVALPKRLGGG